LESKLKGEERHIKELYGIEKRKLESEGEKRRGKQKLWEMDEKQKENECESLRNRIVKEKVEFE